jgi:Tfp pilus assembly protein PilE
LHSKAFTLLELAITIFLAGLLGSLGYFYLNTSSLKKSHYTTALQSHINLVESMIFQCKSLSEQFPKELDTSTNASDTLLTELECNTSTPYSFNGGRNGFVPIPPTGFSPYKATESGNTFYIFTSAENNSTQHEALQKLIVNYNSQQATLESNATSTTFKFYLSR